MSILVSPVRIVIIVVCQPVRLIGGSSLCGAFCGVAPCGDGERVAIVPSFLHAEEVGEGVVERTFRITSVSPAVGDVSSDGPSAAVESRCVGVHAAKRVVTVGSTQCQSVSSCHASGAEVVIVASCHSCH